MIYLSILGDSKRGNEVINFLLKLGGENKYNLDGYDEGLYYGINDKNIIYSSKYKRGEFVIKLI